MAIRISVLILVTLATIGVVKAASQFYNDEMKLLRDLTGHNNVHLRPVANTSQTLTVSLGLALIKIMDVDEVKGTLSVQAWKRYLWKDESLKWDLSDYGNINHIRIPADRIWKPDIVLYNSASPSTEEDVYNALAVVSSDGTVLWIPSALLTAQCSFDMTSFPFDEQTCLLKFGSWTYDGFRLDISFYDSLEEVDVTDYLGHTEWHVTECPAKKNTKYYPCCEEPYPDLTFNVGLKRRTNYLGTMYIGPAVLVSLLLPFVFILPTLGASRYFAAVGGLIIMIIQIQNLHQLMPQGRLSLLGTYYMSVFALNFLVLWVAILVTSVANRAHTNIPPPGFLKQIFINGLGKIMCVSKTAYKSLSEREELQINEDGSQKAPSPGAGGGEWLTIARVMDRIFCIITFVLIFILAVACIPK